MSSKTIAIIGAGFAGISAGIYAQMNDYQSQIFELHTQPGGLCTSWKRKGYTIDGCIHWLVGSSPTQSLYRFWQEVGLVQGRRFIDHELYAVYEGSDGRVFNVYVNPDQLEKHMLELSPQDATPIRELVEGIRFTANFEPPSDNGRGLIGFFKQIGFMLGMLPKMPMLQKWSKTSIAEVAARFQDPLLRQGLLEMWYPEFSAMALLMTLAWMNKKAAGYPIGGSMPMTKAIEKRYLDLGGQVHYGVPVEKILVENNCAVGVRLKDGSEHRAEVVISAADGYATIFKMLEGRYVDDKIKGYYEKMPTFPGLVFVGVGVNRSFADEPQSVAGIRFPLKEPITIGGTEYDSLSAHLFNYDPTLAPEGKSVLTIMFNGDYDYWKKLAVDPGAYESEKDAVSETILDGLEQRWPGIARQVEMIDVATPLTFERYTGNWKGSFEGWLVTPQNVTLQMANILPGLDNFYMAGQWVQPGGGLPGGVMSGRRAIVALCKKDKKKFHATIA
jgi:phytoene dehydrogenase-like protein